SLVLLGMSYGAPWITVVALKAIAGEMGGARSVPALANALAWLGTAAGGILMGRLADRFGVRATVTFGSAAICIGLYVSSLGQPWQLYVGHGLFIGLLGNAGLNAPLYVYVSRWFDRRRGSALALISSGGYLAGFVWPPLFERAIALLSWQWTMLAFALLQLAVILPLAIIFLRPPPEMPDAAGTSHGDGRQRRGAGWPAQVGLCPLGFSAFLCRVPLSLPAGRLAPACTDHAL